jgi:hypothetical protein
MAMGGARIGMVKGKATLRIFGAKPADVINAETFRQSFICNWRCRHLFILLQLRIQFIDYIGKKLSRLLQWYVNGLPRAFSTDHTSTALHCIE